MVPPGGYQARPYQGLERYLVVQPGVLGLDDDAHPARQCEGDVGCNHAWSYCRLSQCTVGMRSSGEITAGRRGGNLAMRDSRPRLGRPFTQAAERRRDAFRWRHVRTNPAVRCESHATARFPAPSLLHQNDTVDTRDTADTLYFARPSAASARRMIPMIRMTQLTHFF